MTNSKITLAKFHYNKKTLDSHEYMFYNANRLNHHN